MVVGNTRIMSKRRVSMRCAFKRQTVALTIAAFALITIASQILSAEEDLVHIVSGVVKHVDKDTKTMVVKTSDGTEHTIMRTGETTWEGTKETGKGIKEGSQVSVKYTEKAGEKTAVGVKDVGKATAKAVD
jgi:hypothetical protein